jgi:hypothetical protein
MFRLYNSLYLNWQHRRDAYDDETPMHEEYRFGFSPVDVYTHTWLHDWRDGEYDKTKLSESKIARNAIRSARRSALVSLDLEDWRGPGTLLDAQVRAARMIRAVNPGANIGQHGVPDFPMHVAQSRPNCPAHVTERFWQGVGRSMRATDEFDHGECVLYTTWPDLYEMLELQRIQIRTLGMIAQRHLVYISPQMFIRRRYDSRGWRNRLADEVEGGMDYWRNMLLELREGYERGYIQGAILWGLWYPSPGIGGQAGRLTAEDYLVGRPWYDCLCEVFGVEPLPRPWQFVPGDVNGDGYVNGLDISAFKKALE